MSFEDFVRTEMPMRQVTLSDAGPPNQGAGAIATIGSYYLDTSDNYKRYVKTGSANTAWEVAGTGNPVLHVMTRSSQQITTPDDTANGGYEPEFLAMQSDNAVGDSIYEDLTYEHAMVLPYDTVVKRIILRGAATQSSTINVSIHSNRDVTNTATIDYKYFPEAPVETVAQTFSTNNEPKIYTFAASTSANAGDTLGISLSANGDVGHTNATVVLEYSV